jgi:predicted nucleic acid-binding protein
MWYAAADRGEAFNVRAKALLNSEDSLVTTDHVLVETWLLIRQRLSKEAAQQFWAGMRSGVARMICVGEADLEHAWNLGAAWSDQSFSVADLTSFAVMLRLGLERVASLDDDFAVFRYGPARRRAFEIVR